MATRGITIQLHSCPDTIKEDGQVQPFKGQNYRELKQECLQKKSLFEDPEFEASLQSLGYNIRIPDTWSYPKLSWKRPRDIVTIGRPHFINEGMTLQDVRQLGLGDCWFMAAAACLTLNKELLCRVVPPNQSFAEGDYAGIFHFQFWHYGKWVDVVVDDRLPVLDGELHFADGNESHDFWMPLLEKAYAKLYGSYNAIEGGELNEAFVDLTGGIGKRIILSDIQSNRFETIKFALEKKSLLGASVQELKDQDSGLGRHHAYSITGVYKLNIGGREQKLLRLRNPWGKKEWTRNWSDWSDKWSSLDPAIRKELNIQEEDGEFWIELDDFTTNFATVDICYLSINSFDKEGVQTFWKTTNIEGAWTKETSGGNMTQKATFWNNPRFLFSLRKPSDAEWDSKGKESGLRKYSCVISLVQKTRGTRNQWKTLFFYIFQVSEKVSQKDLQLLTTTQDDQLLSELRYADEASDHDWSRALTKKFQLSPGDYLLIPSTEFADEEGDFILRIFTEANHECLEICGEIYAEKKALYVEIPRSTKENSKIKEIFKHYAGKDTMIGTDEFKKYLDCCFLNSGRKLKDDGFSVVDCQKIVQHFDETGTGKLSLDAFEKFWTRINEWEDIFNKFDTNRSGTSDNYEIHLALESAGFHLNHRTIEALMEKCCFSCYELCFQTFVLVLIFLESLFRTVNSWDTNRTGKIKMSEKEWEERIKSF